MRGKFLVACLVAVGLAGCSFKGSASREADCLELKRAWNDPQALRTHLKEVAPKDPLGLFEEQKPK